MRTATAAKPAWAERPTSHNRSIMRRGSLSPGGPAARCSPLPSAWLEAAFTTLALRPCKSFDRNGSAAPAMTKADSHSPEKSAARDSPTARGPSAARSAPTPPERNTGMTPCPCCEERGAPTPSTASRGLSPPSVAGAATHPDSRAASFSPRGRLATFNGSFAGLPCDRMVRPTRRHRPAPPMAAPGKDPEKNKEAFITNR